MQDGILSDRIYSPAVVAVIILLIAGTAAFVGVPGDLATTFQAGTQDEGTLHDGTQDQATATFVSNASHDNAGYDIASAGDVNGDGIQDVLVAAPFNDTNGPNSGAVYLFYGPIDAGDVDVGEADVTFAGASGDRAGWSVAAGDLDGDGDGDVVVGAPQNDTNGANAGAVYVVYGGESLSGTVDLERESDAALLGAGVRDLAGYDVATVPGADGDADALVVGAPRNNSTSTDAGAAYLVGAPDGERTALPEAADVLYVGTGRGDRAGLSVAAAGDVTGDGSHEVVVGAPRNDSLASTAGAAYVLATDYSGEVPVDDGLVLQGVGPNDRAGFAVSGAGDANVDGRDDVLVGAPYNDSAGEDAGAAYVVYGRERLAGNLSLAEADLVLTGGNASDRAGWAVSGGGSIDPDCDRHEDVLVGAPYNDSAGEDAGVAYLVSGEEDGERSLSRADAVFRGEGEGDLAGWALADVNDSTDDERRDVMVAAIHNDSGGNESGAAYLLESGCPLAPEPPTGSPAASPAQSPTPTGSPAPSTSPTPTESPASTPTASPTPAEATPTSGATPTPDASPTPSPTPADSRSPTPTPDESARIERVHPEGSPEIRPDTSVWFEADADVSKDDVAWRVYEEGDEPGDYSWDIGPVSDGWPTHLYRTSFDEPGTYVVEATITDDDGATQSSTTWTVTVSESAPAPPTRDAVSPSGTVYLDETEEWTVGVASGGEAPHRVGWWIAQCDYLEAIDSLDTPEDTSTIEFPVNNAYHTCEPAPIVIDANGMTTGLSYLWDLTYEEPLAVEITNTETAGEVTVDVSNVGTETHEVDVELEVQAEDGRYRSEDTESVTLDSGETRSVTLDYQDDREEFEVRVTARTGDETRVTDTATVTRSDGGSSTPTETPTETPMPTSMESENTTETPTEDGGGGAGGNNSLAGPNSVPGFRLGWAATSLTLLAGLVHRRN